MKPRSTAPVSAIDDGEGIESSWHQIIEYAKATARSAGAAYVLTDQPWTRRQTVHYVWWPDADEPELHRQFCDILDAAEDHGTTKLLVHADVTESKMRAIVIASDSTTRDD